MKKENLSTRFSTVQELREEIEKEKGELKTTEEKEASLKNELNECTSALRELQEQKSNIRKKLVVLRSRRSGLAKILFEEIKNEYKNIEQVISSKKNEKGEIQQALNSIQKSMEELKKNIKQKEEEPDIYIDIQCSIMVNEFITYMKKNIKEFGREITKEFYIKDVTKTFRYVHYGSTEVPTGNIGIYDMSKETFIVISSDFYFDIELFKHLGPDWYNCPMCIDTTWYCEYQKKFKSELLKILKKEFNIDEFELTIKDEGFTLDLR